jgi:hypothetical protein
LTVKAVSAFVRPYDYWYDRYQAFYQHSLRLRCAAAGATFDVVPMTRLPHLLKPLRDVRDRYLTRAPGTWTTSLVDRLALRLEGPVRTPSSSYHNAIGQYVVRTADGTTCRVCIDTADYPELRSDELLSWSDLYFKANLWPSRPYPPNVLPIVNGDPLILDRIPTLRSYRRVEKATDVCFVVRVWGGRDGIEGIEHNLRLLEAVNGARCSKTVIAYLVTGDTEAIAERLGKSGIHSTTRPIRPNALWRLMGSSRLNIIRLGMHDCIPWRMAGTLAMGSCVVLDQTPLAAWPEPLRENVNFFNLSCGTGETPASDADYAAVPAKIEEWLSQPAKLEQVMSTNAAYFDRHVDPERVGEAILAAVETHASRLTSLR